MLNIYTHVHERTHVRTQTHTHFTAFQPTRAAGVGSKEAVGSFSASASQEEGKAAGSRSWEHQPASMRGSGEVPASGLSVGMPVVPKLSEGTRLRKSYTEPALRSAVFSGVAECGHAVDTQDGAICSVA